MSKPSRLCHHLTNAAAKHLRVCQPDCTATPVANVPNGHPSDPCFQDVVRLGILLWDWYVSYYIASTVRVGEGQQHSDWHLERDARLAVVLSEPKSSPLTLPAGAIKGPQIFCALFTAQVYTLVGLAHACSPQFCRIRGFARHGFCRC